MVLGGSRHEQKGHAMSQSVVDIAHESALTKLEELTALLEPLGFETVIVDDTGAEPFVSLDMGDGRVLDLTAKLRMFCNCCDLDGTHDHLNCEHPCCSDYDDA